MSTVTSARDKSSTIDEDTDSFRMTIGQHLEELRNRIFLGLGGFILVLIVCLFFGDQVLLWFCRPLIAVLEAKQLNSQLMYQQLGEGFKVWFKVCCIVAGAVAAPWIVFQLWQFVAAGLYPEERKYVTRYAPLSIALLVSGMAFVYVFVLPWSIEFLIGFANDVPMPQSNVATAQSYEPFKVPILAGDPMKAQVGEIWFNSSSGRLSIQLPNNTRSINFRSENLLSPEIALEDYIDLVVAMLVMFGLSFQMPLIVLALVRIGIIETKTIKKFRKHVYFALAITAAAITPGSDIMSMLGLTIPLCLLFEFGLWLARDTRARGPGFPVESSGPE